MTHARTAFAENSDQEIVDVGDGNAITYTTYGSYMPITTGASGETNTVTAPTSASQEMTLHMVVDGGGDRVVTFPAVLNVANETIATFAAVDDCLIVKSVQIAGAAGTYRWQVVLNDNITLS